MAFYDLNDPRSRQSDPFGPLSIAETDDPSGVGNSSGNPMAPAEVGLFETPLPPIVAQTQANPDKSIIFGSMDDDVIVGTAEADQIVGTDSADIIMGDGRTLEDMVALGWISEDAAADLAQASATDPMGDIS